MNILTLLEMAADAMGNRQAVTGGSQTLTVAELHQAALGGATLARAAATSRLAYLAVNTPAAPAALFAAAAAGMPYVPINYRLTRPEIDALLIRVAPALLITDKDGPFPPGITPISPDAFLAQAQAAAPAAAPPDDDSAIAVELFTSGTTGTPKAAILRHENLTAYVLGSVEFMSAEEDDATIVTVPPYHIAGISAVLSSLYAGRHMLQLPDFTPRAWLDLVRAHNVSNAFVVPTMLARITEHLDASGEHANTPSLRALAYGGGKMPLPIIQRAISLFPNTDFTNAYGLTETSSTIALLTPDDHRAAHASTDAGHAKRLTSVGRPLPGIELEIRDESNAPVPANISGLVYVRGDQVAGEYHGQPSQKDAQGWFCTKDRGYLDDAGYLFLEGRADDVIVRGGENISPGEIEEILQSHPSVRDAAAVAMPDPEWGEAVAAAIVLQPGATTTEGELQSHVRAALRSSRVPHTIRFYESLPYNDTGKLLRRVIRQDFQ